jgi:glycosyltransferase involved in cell wall biosynthesis
VTPRVLLVTGAYFPEISSAGVQTRDVARALAGRAQFRVLTTAVDRSLPAEAVVDGVPVHRLRVDVDRLGSRIAAGATLIRTFTRLAAQIDLVHIHGFSSKNVLVAMLARLFRKRVILTLHTAGQDDPRTVQARGALAWWAYRGADLFMSVSPQLSQQFRESPLASRAFEEVANGVDTSRFHPASAGERASLRRELGLPVDASMVLFVGFFSRDKRPDLLCEAWRRVASRAAGPVILVCVGAANSAYFEVDPALADGMRAAAAQSGLADRLVLVEPTNAIDKYFRSADIYVLPSAREAMPMALLEAMACGLPSIATRLPRVTDVIIEDGSTGILTETVDDIAGALDGLVGDRARAAAMGARARDAAVERFGIDRTASRWLAAYQRVLAA